MAVVVLVARGEAGLADRVVALDLGDDLDGERQLRRPWPTCFAVGQIEARARRVLEADLEAHSVFDRFEDEGLLLPERARMADGFRGASLRRPDERRHARSVKVDDGER